MLHILNGSRHFTLRNSVLKAETVSASFGINLFKMENTKKDEDGYNNDYVTIENNQLRGGYIALNISGTGYVALQKERGAVVRNNIVNNAGSKGIYLSDETDALLDNNTIISSETKKKSYIAIDVFRSKGRLVIRNNKIVNNQTAYSTGINLRNEVSGTVEQPALVYNNSIITKIGRASCRERV